MLISQFPKHPATFGYQVPCNNTLIILIFRLAFGAAVHVTLDTEHHILIPELLLIHLPLYKVLMDD